MAASNTVAAGAIFEFLKGGMQEISLPESIKNFNPDSLSNTCNRHAIAEVATTSGKHFEDDAAAFISFLNGNYTVTDI